MRFLRYFCVLLFPSFYELGTRVAAYFWMACLHIVANYGNIIGRGVPLLPADVIHITVFSLLISRVLPLIVIIIFLDFLLFVFFL